MDHRIVSELVEVEERGLVVVEEVAVLEESFRDGQDQVVVATEGNGAGFPGLWILGIAEHLPKPPDLQTALEQGR